MLLTTVGINIAFDTLPASAQQIREELPPTAKMRLREHSSEDEWNGVYLLQFSGDGKYLAARTRDQVVQVYELANKKLVHKLDGHEGFIRAIVFTGDSENLLTAASGDEEFVRIWNFKTGEDIGQIPGGGQFLEITGSDEVIVVDSLERRRAQISSCDIVEMKNLRLPGEQILGVAPGSEQFAVFRSSSRRQSYFPIRIVSGKNKDATQLTGINSEPKRVFFSSDGQFAAAVYKRENEGYFWSLKNDTRKFALTGHADSVETVCFSSDSRFLATASWDQTVNIWDIVSGSVVSTLKGHQGHVCSIAFSEDSKWLASGASGNKDCSILIWDVDKNLFESSNTVRLQVENNAELLWKLLGDADAHVALGAVQVLVEQFGQLQSLIEQNVSMLLNVTDASQILELIEQLNDPVLARREAAQDRLLEVRPAAERLLQQHVETTISAEVRIRILQILDQPFKRPKIAEDEWRRMLRLVHALERINDETASELLSRISLGHSHIDVSLSATDALKRINQKRTNRQTEQLKLK